MKSLLMGLRSSRPFLETYNATFFFHSFERFLSIIGVCVCVCLTPLVSHSCQKPPPQFQSHKTPSFFFFFFRVGTGAKSRVHFHSPIPKRLETRAPPPPSNPKIKCYDPKKWRRIRRVCVYTHFLGRGKDMASHAFENVYYVQIEFPQNSPPLRNHESSTYYENTKTTWVIFAYQNEQMSQYWKQAGKGMFLCPVCCPTTCPI